MHDQRVLAFRNHIVALAKETQAVTTGTAAKGGFDDTGGRTHISSVDVVSVGGLVTARDTGIIATLGLGLLDGVLLINGELNVVNLVRDTFTIRNSHSNGGEEESSDNEFHVDSPRLVICFVGSQENSWLGRVCAGRGKNRRLSGVDEELNARMEEGFFILLMAA